jgi:hypothetical protein
MRNNLALVGFVVAVFIPFLWAASAEVDLDYSHAIKGSGTLVTDFRMGSQLNAEVSGKVRGTGQMVNKYVFLTGNNSNVTVRDEFQLTEPKPLLPSLANYPKMPEDPLKFKLVGMEWAERLEVKSTRQNEGDAQPQVDAIAAGMNNESGLSSLIPSTIAMQNSSETVGS